MQILPVLKVVAELIPIIGNIFAIFRRKKAEKKMKKLEKVAQAVILGVDKYDKIMKDTEITKKDKIKEVIKTIAVDTGVQEKLHELVTRWTKLKIKD